MNPFVYYTLSIACFGLLIASYCTGIADTPYYPFPFPGNLPDGDESNPVYFVRGAVEVHGEVFEAFELAFGPHSPVNSSFFQLRPLEQTLSLFATEMPSDPENRGPLQFLEGSACSPLSEPLNGAIALVSGSGCSYAAQVANCAAAGAVGVIISDDVPLSSQPNDPAVEVPAFLVLPRDFGVLTNLAETNEIATLWTLSGSSALSFAGFILVLMARPLLTVGCVFFLFHGNLERKKQRMRAKPEAVAALPTLLWSPERETPFQQTGCAICLENYTDGCGICILPCQHEFHTQCVRPWLLSERGVCPLCLNSITAEA